MNTRALFNHTPTTRAGEIALRAAIAAGRVLQKKFYETREVRSKGFRDIVTDADFAADRAARAILAQAFPEYAVLSEEDSAPPKSSEYTWIVDPLDGTTNYARRIPIFSVSLALTRRGQPIVSVVYDPLRRECFFAERGRGAFLNGVKIRASKIATLDRAVIGYELARAPELRALGSKLFAHFSQQGVTARAGGSAALSLCYIAAGRLDTYMQLTLSAWDVAAGILLIREAGGRVTHLDGKAATLNGGSYFAGAPRVFPEFINQVNQVINGSAT